MAAMAKNLVTAGKGKSYSVRKKHVRTYYVNDSSRSVRHPPLGDVRQVRQGGADAALPGRDPDGVRAARRTRQERHDHAVEARHHEGRNQDGCELCLIH